MGEITVTGGARIGLVNATSPFASTLGHIRYEDVGCDTPLAFRMLSEPRPECG